MKPSKEKSFIKLFIKNFFMILYKIVEFTIKTTCQLSYKILNNCFGKTDQQLKQEQNAQHIIIHHKYEWGKKWTTTINYT